MSSGKPDINGSFRGMFFRLEVKTPDNKNEASKKQLLDLKRWGHTGAIIGVVYSKAAVEDIFTASGLTIKPGVHYERLEANDCRSWIEMRKL